MKKIMMLLGMCVVTVGLAGCGSDTVQVNVENIDDLVNTSFGTDALVEIGSYLYYDTSTLIVYWWNGGCLGYAATVPTPYYGPNGFPYRYDPKTNTFMEIMPD